MSLIFALCPLFFASSALAAMPAQDKEVVKVNGTPIRQSEVLERLWERHGGEILEELVDEMLLRQAVQKSKLEASGAEVDRRLAKVKGQFSDPKLLELELAKAGSNMDKLTADIKEQILREKLLVNEKKLAVSEDDLKKAFEQHKDQLGEPEAVHLKHLVVERRGEAEKIAEDIRKGADFAAIAKEKSISSVARANGGDYGFVPRGMMPPSLEKPAYALKDKEVAVVESEKGYSVIQVVGRRAAVPAVFAKVKDDLREAMIQEKIKAALPDFMRGLREKADIKSTL